MSVVPTTVSSNVVMTGQAGGDEAASTTEVIIGNLIGTFLSPALLEMFFASSRWEFGRPDAGQGGGIGEVYRKVIEQVSSLNSRLFLPKSTQHASSSSARLHRLHPSLCRRSYSVHLAQTDETGSDEAETRQSRQSLPVGRRLVDVLDQFLRRGIRHPLGRSYHLYPHDQHFPLHPSQHFPLRFGSLCPLPSSDYAGGWPESQGEGSSL